MRQLRPFSVPSIAWVPVCTTTAPAVLMRNWHLVYSRGRLNVAGGPFASRRRIVDGSLRQSGIAGGPFASHRSALRIATRPDYLSTGGGHDVGVSITPTASSATTGVHVTGASEQDNANGKRCNEAGEV